MSKVIFIMNKQKPEKQSHTMIKSKDQEKEPYRRAVTKS